MKFKVTIALLVLLSLADSGCGGGQSSGANPTTSPPAVVTPQVVTVTASGHYTVAVGTIVEIDDSALVLTGGNVSRWYLSPPSGSSSIMSNDTSSAISAPVTPNFQTDIAGQYVATLKIAGAGGITTVSLLYVTAN
ncbi:MAG: hypothetical protein HOP24_09840 [Sideroxydans sp.]|nr:hypothetical protein [Sideroxydans sp.]